MNSIGSSIVIICSSLTSFILSSIETIVVDLPDQVGHVIRNNHCLAVIIFSSHGGNHNSSIFLASLSILRKTNHIFHNLKYPFTRKGVQSFAT